MFKKISLTILILALVAFGIYWFFYRTKTSTPVVNTDGSTDPSGFTPINRNPFPDGSNPDDVNGSSATSTSGEVINGAYHVPQLRKISSTPVSGFAASTTASTSLVRYMDRGTGHVYEANDLSSTISKISNTTLPKIYESYWNGNANQSVIRYLKEDTDIITNFYAELRKLVSTSTDTVPFEIKGLYLSSEIKEVVRSPIGSQIFTFNKEGGKGVGYISNFDENKRVKIFDTPITEANIDWPETNTLTITTKGSASAMGYMYGIDIKTSTIKKLLNAQTRGLSAKMNRDGSRIFYSALNNGKVFSYFLNTKDNSTQEVVFRTLADKCVWSNLRKNEIYCAVPTEFPTALYPDDWYKGTVSLVDQIWYLNTETGEVTLIANPLKLANDLIDATNLTLDNKDNFLYFINKRDLSLWALDLNQ